MNPLAKVIILIKNEVLEALDLLSDNADSKEKRLNYFCNNFLRNRRLSN